MHVEFVTFCLSCAGVAAAGRGRLGLAALCFSLVSTQNPPWALVSLLLGVAWVVRGARERRFDGRDAAGFAAGAVLSVLHPAYYLARLGTFTPQEKLDILTHRPAALANFWRVWFDLDIGLFAYWPLGVLLAAVAGALAWRRRVRPPAAALAIAGVSALALALAQASTTHINHGGTVNVSRYGTWYLCLALAPLVLVVRRAAAWPAGRRGVLGAAAAGALFWNVLTFHPGAAETCFQPSFLSRWVARVAPRWYPWNGEIFYDRYNQGPQIIYDRFDRLTALFRPPEEIPAWVSNPEGTLFLVQPARLADPARVRPDRPVSLTWGLHFDPARFVAELPHLRTTDANLPGWRFVIPSPRQRARFVTGRRIELFYFGDFRYPETNAAHRWRWCGPWGGLHLVNREPAACRLRLEMAFGAASPDNGTLVVESGPRRDVVPLRCGELTAYGVTVDLPPHGRANVFFTYTGGFLPAPAENRALGFALFDLDDH